MSLTTRKKQAQAQASAGLDLARQTATRVTPVAKDAAAKVTPVAKDAAAKVTPVAKDAAAKVTPVAKDVAARVTPLAQAAGAVAAARAQDAREWVQPRLEQGVHQARVWAAPRIEQAGQSISETVAPKVSDLMTATARRVEPDNVGRKRVWRRLFAGALVAGALAGVFAALRRRRVVTLPDDVMSDDMVAPPAEPGAEPDGDEIIVEAEVGANGHRPTT